jgi:hypothetical protein
VNGNHACHRLLTPQGLPLHFRARPGTPQSAAANLAPCTTTTEPTQAQQASLGPARRLRPACPTIALEQGALCFVWQREKRASIYPHPISHPETLTLRMLVSYNYSRCDTSNPLPPRSSLAPQTALIQRLQVAHRSLLRQQRGHVPRCSQGGPHLPAAATPLREHAAAAWGTRTCGQQPASLRRVAAVDCSRKGSGQSRSSPHCHGQACASKTRAHINATPVNATSTASKQNEGLAAAAFCAGIRRAPKCPLPLQDWGNARDTRRIEHQLAAPGLESIHRHPLHAS